ncbi:MAG: hypothetical protein M3512_05225 [Bacteroidota bacterium]|nr:hypothetical protein [Bacteroidota bacterium]
MNKLKLLYLQKFTLNNQDIFKIVRNSRMKLEEVYFWTATINDWKTLLKQ